ncbi:hypothetical protein CLIB1444_01S02014 [[Candida] jaroonii]|uniref:Uncharacterized protein n=1 Tax=[Candida] jaroonii TaxID=467808 RepID=A0ACA9Y008_9ASCO|nr:hypothetical protein CLIB1444_01S02014 [[Candida] jaroonii]
MSRPNFKARIIVMLALIMFAIVIYNDSTDTESLGLLDALYLTKNSFKEFRNQLLGKNDHVAASGLNEIDYPLNSMVNSVFPIDSLIQVNYTDHKDNRNVSTEVVGRYASFSPILSSDLYSQFQVLDHNACSIIPDISKYENKVLVVLRGDCTFVEKVENILKSELKPKTIIIANDEPFKGLITMYSSTFNEDRSIKIPIMFITYESYQFLKKLNKEDLTIRISTASLGNWINILLSLILSPPLLIIIFYCLIQVIHNCRKLQKNRFSEKIVKNLPVYIYNKNHLIHCKDFYKYLNITGQTDAAIENLNDSQSSIDSYPLISDSPKFDNIDITNAKPTPSSSNPALNSFVINGVDIKALTNRINVLFMHDDFYPAFKCSICLDRFKPLRSRVLILDCKHFFHENCLSNWLINFKRSCPLCNHSIANIPHNLLAGQVNDYGSLDLEAQIESEYNHDSSSQMDDNENTSLSSEMTTQVLQANPLLSEEGSSIPQDSIPIGIQSSASGPVSESESESTLSFKTPPTTFADSDTTSNRSSFYVSHPPTGTANPTLSRMTSQEQMDSTRQLIDEYTSRRNLRGENIEFDDDVTSNESGDSNSTINLANS